MVGGGEPSVVGRREALGLLDPAVAGGAGGVGLLPGE
jgi:hypothetical protein